MLLGLARRTAQHLPRQIEKASLSYRRRKSKDLVEKPGMLHEDSSEGTPSLGETT